MPTDPNLTKAQRRDAARAEALQLRKEQERRDRRNRSITIGALVALVVVVVVAAIFITKAGNAKNAPKALSDVSMPSTANSVGGIPLGKDGTAGTTAGDGKPTLDLYIDYMCPVCGQFEKVNQADIDALRTAGDVTVVLHPMNILDASSEGTKYSTRAANAFGTVADKDPAQAAAFSSALFANQPQENTPGLTDDEIANLASALGVPKDVVDSFKDGTFNDWVDSATQRAGTDTEVQASGGGVATPTILIDGKRWTGNWSQAGTLKQAILDAKG